MEEKCKIVILCGGFGTRLSEETELKPKPMVEIGEKPILWHIMKIYSAYGFNDFVLCLGYKGYIIKEYFVNYFTHQSDITVDIENNKIEVHRRKLEPWKVTLIDTGIDTFTALRIKKVKEYVGDKTFMLTYGDGVGDIDVRQLLRFHKKSGKYATVTAVQLPGRFGTLALRKDDAVSSFQEKPKSDGSWINGGFFVLEPEIFRYLGDDNILWEKGPIEHIAADGQLTAYRHHGFWKPMDTLRDKNELEKLWQSGNPPWKVWK